jgi:hypothetical protein
MKTLSEIYDSIVSKFKSKTNLDIYKGSVIDKYTISVSAGIEDAYQEIENNKNPHIYTKLTGSDIDSVGILVGCARMENEDDMTYLYRMLNWNKVNQCSNSTAIEASLLNMNYASNVTFIPYTHGVATGTAYIIPKSLDQQTIDAAIKETKDRLKDITAASSYIEYIVPEILKVQVIAYLSVYKDESNVKQNIANKFQDYINNIAPGSLLEVGKLNKIGIDETNVSYFSISSVIINGVELQDLNIIQKLEKKFVFDDITWNMVVND